jgi:hypothetical protein
MTASRYIAYIGYVEFKRHVRLGRVLFPESSPSAVPLGVFIEDVFWILMTFYSSSLIQIVVIIFIDPLKTKKVKTLFYPTLCNLRKSVAFGRVPTLYSFVLQVRATYGWKWMWSTGGMKETGEDRISRRNPVPVLLFPPQISYGLTDWFGIEPGPPRWETGD